MDRTPFPITLLARKRVRPQESNSARILLRNLSVANRAGRAFIADNAVDSLLPGSRWAGSGGSMETGAPFRGVDSPTLFTGAALNGATFPLRHDRIASQNERQQCDPSR